MSWSPGRLVVSGADYAAVVGSARATPENPDPALFSASVASHVGMSLVRFASGGPPASAGWMRAEESGYQPDDDSSQAPTGRKKRQRRSEALPSVRPGGRPDGNWLFTAVGRTDRVGSVGSRGVPGLLVLGGGPAQLETLAGAVTFRGISIAAATVLDPAGLAINPIQPLGSNHDTLPLPANSPWISISAREQP